MIWFVVILLFIANIAFTGWLFYNLLLRVEKAERDIKEIDNYVFNESEDI